MLRYTMLLHSRSLSSLLADSHVSATMALCFVRVGYLFVCAEILEYSSHVG
jgi:hypothetical protein